MDRLSEVGCVIIIALMSVCSTSFLNNNLHSQRHMDIFDLVSGMQKEAMKEEKLEKRRELKERKRLKEMHKGREWEKEVGREKEKANEEVLCCRGLKDFEFHVQHNL